MPPGIPPPPSPWARRLHICEHAFDCGRPHGEDFGLRRLLYFEETLGRGTHVPPHGAVVMLLLVSRFVFRFNEKALLVETLVLRGTKRREFCAGVLFSEAKLFDVAFLQGGVDQLALVLENDWVLVRRPGVLHSHHPHRYVRTRCSVSLGLLDCRRNRVGKLLGRFRLDRVCEVLGPRGIFDHFDSTDFICKFVETGHLGL